MECCDIDVCDFVEIEIEEYDDEDEYYDDFLKEGEYYTSKNGLPKGTVIEHKYTDDYGNDKSEYYYPPLFTFKTRQEERKWLCAWVDEFVKKQAKYTEGAVYKWLFERSTKYPTNELILYRWRFSKYSCVRVDRDRDWFARRKQKFLRNQFSIKDGVPYTKA